MKHPVVMCLLLVTAAMWACLPGGRSALPPAPPTPERIAPTVTPSSTPSGYPGCYYTWATRELPDLSAKVNAALRSLDLGATGSAYAFGEDCVHDDGTKVFSAMETDFRIKVQAASLDDEQGLGDAMSAVMKAVENLAPEDLQGPRSGRVEFEFIDQTSASLRLIVDITRFQNEAAGLTGAQLFRYFYASP